MLDADPNLDKAFRVMLRKLRLRAIRTTILGGVLLAGCQYKVGGTWISIAACIVIAVFPIIAWWRFFAIWRRILRGEFPESAADAKRVLLDAFTKAY